MNYTSNLVTSKIDKALADKIVKDRIKSAGNTVINIYVSANGSDETGDGSQGKPYKTINHIFSNVLSKVYSSNQIIIIPLTDIVENQRLIFNQLTPYIGLNTQNSGHTITFNSKYRTESCKIEHNHCVFNEGVECSEQSYLYFRECTFKKGSSSCPLTCYYSSTCILENAVIDGETNNVSGINCSSCAVVHIRNAITFKGAFSYLVRANSQGVYSVLTGVSFITTEASGAKYSLIFDSVLNLQGQGDSIFGDHLTDGTKDESSVIC